MAEEVNRVDQYLQPRTLEPLLGVVDTVLIIHQQDVITGEFESLLHEYRIAGLFLREGKRKGKKETKQNKTK